MSRRVIGMAFTNQARGDKSNNNAIGGIGARGTAVRNAIISRSTNCCNRSFGSSGNENFITLAQALQQGGVNSGQILFLCNNQELVLSNNFTIQNGGFVIFCDIENPQGNVPSNSRSIDVNKFAGVFVPQGKKLVVHGEIVLGNISSNAANNKDVYGVYNKGTIEISETGSITMGDIRSVNQNAHGIFQESTIQKHTVSNSAGAIQMGNITSENANAFGVKNGDLNDVRVQIGNVSGSGEVAAVNLFLEVDNVGSMSAHVIAGDVTNSGTSATRGLYVYNLSGSFSCGDVSSTGQSTPDNVIEVTGLLFTTVYPEAQVNIGNISATNGICRGVFSESETAILAGTTNIGSVSSNVNFDYNNSDVLQSGGIVINTQNLSDSFVTYNGIGKGLKFEVSINNDLYALTIIDFASTTNYTNGDQIMINGAYFGGDNTNNVILTINSVDANGEIEELNITGTPPTDPRVTTTGLITTNGLSGNFIVKDCSLTKAPNVVVNAKKIINAGINVTTLNGSVTCGNVEGTGNVIGISVATLSGSTTCGNVKGTGERVIGISVNTLNGSATCGNVEGDGTVSGIRVYITLNGSATCGNVSLTGTGTASGIVGTTLFSTLSGSATCGTVEGIGIDGGTINGNVIIKSASTGVANLADGSGKVIIGVPQGGGNSGTDATNKLSAYIYGGSVVIPTP